MTRLRVIPIVEGHGECTAAPLPIRRIWHELLQGEYVDVLKPIRSKRNLLVKEEGLCQAVELALSKLRNSPSLDPALVLILIDQDPGPDPACLMAPQMLGFIRRHFAHASASCVTANVEYETWFVAAAESLSKYLRLAPREVVPQDPEGQRCGKGWIASRFSGARYSETQDQTALTAAMDLELCRRRSPSFDKLCRELQAAMRANPAL